MDDKSTLLILGYGNPARGDDGLAPELIHQLNREQKLAKLPDTFCTLTEFQLQIENTLDLEKHPRILLVDASSSLKQPFKLSRVRARNDSSYSSHALSPAALLLVFQQTSHVIPPPVYLLAIKGTSYELGEPLSSSANQNLHEALTFTHNLIRRQQPAYWDHCIDKTAD